MATGEGEGYDQDGKTSLAADEDGTDYGNGGQGSSHWQEQAHEGSSLEKQVERRRRR